MKIFGYETIKTEELEALRSTLQNLEATVKDQKKLIEDGGKLVLDLQAENGRLTFLGEQTCAATELLTKRYEALQEAHKLALESKPQTVQTLDEVIELIRAAKARIG